MRVFFILSALLWCMPALAANDPNKTLLDVQAVQKRNNEISVDHFTKMIAKDPKDATAYARRGKAYSGLKEYDKALEDVEKAIALDPKLAEAYMTRAVVHYVKEDYRAAWEDVNKVEENGGQMWPSFMEALKAKTGGKNGGNG